MKKFLLIIFIFYSIINLVFPFVILIKLFKLKSLFQSRAFEYSQSSNIQPASDISSNVNNENSSKDSNNSIEINEMGLKNAINV
jgi:hypothetical protein